MSDKTVWIINHYAKSPADSGSTRHFDLAREFCRLGWKTWIVAARIEQRREKKQGPEKGEASDAPGHDGAHFRRVDWNVAQTVTVQEATVHDDVRFRWLNTPDYQGNGLGRVINMLVFAWKLLDSKATAGLKPPTVIIGSTVHLFAAAAAALLARRYRVPFVFEVRDIWPEALIAMGYTRRYSPIAFSLGLLERWLCRRASLIISVMPGYDRYLKERAIKAPEVMYIPHGVNLNNIGDIAPYKKRAPFRITYLGAHGTYNSLLTLIRAMELIETVHQRRTIECRLIGDGLMKQSLIEYCKARGLEQVSFYPPVAKSEIAALVSDTQAFVVCGRELPDLFKYGTSMNKISDCLAMGRPVIIAMEFINNPVLEAGAGLCVPPESPDELAQAILALAEMSEAELQDMGLRGRRFVEQQRNAETQARRLSEMLERL